jgi:alpha-tubulin suppressor-like RCC1 family protein
MALTTDGCVFAWGAGDGGRLGLADVRSRTTPTQISFFHARSSRDDDGSAGTVGSISCGYHHSLAVTGASRCIRMTATPMPLQMLTPIPPQRL